MSEKHNIIPVWFFVGVLFLAYGVLVLASGLSRWSADATSQNAQNDVLAHLHAPVWWGALLIVLGMVYCGAFRPGRKAN